MRTNVAVIFGGRSPEHDVSIKTGLQALNALDQRRFEGIPVYIGLDGRWWTGDGLRKDTGILPGPDTPGLRQVTLGHRKGKPGGALLGTEKPRLFGKPFVLECDVALLALHGSNGEDGRLQGALEIFDIPYTGMRVLPSAVLMDKAATKHALAGTGIPLLPFRLLDRPVRGLIPSVESLETALHGMAYPLIVKPCHLGSSIGVARATSLEELRAALPAIFAVDPQAIVEPCVENLVEFNVAVSAFDGAITTSAIEQPKSATELLDFKAKYLSGTNKTGSKTPQTASDGMLSLTRDINPAMPQDRQDNIRAWAAACFSRIGGTGTPRIDFLCNRETGAVWLNELNPCPGSFAYFLWEAAEKPIQFPDLLSKLIDEASLAHRHAALPADPVPIDAQLFKRA